MMAEEKYTAVVLAAGQGKRMGSSVHKQYLLLHDKPILYYSLKAFEESPVDDIILVVGKGEADFCQKEIIEKYNLKKIKHIVEGGAQRYHSVFHGLCAIEKTDYVLIHDGARPFVNGEIIARSMEAAKAYHACVVGMPVKDTIKLADTERFAEETPNREYLWMIQTPQAFSYPLIYQAYETLLEIEQEKSIEVQKSLLEEEQEKSIGLQKSFLEIEQKNSTEVQEALLKIEQGKSAERQISSLEMEQRKTVDVQKSSLKINREKIPDAKKQILNLQKVHKLRNEWEQIQVTDDAMVVELLSDIPVKLVEGSYENIKITTPEDLKLAEVVCEKK